MLTRIEDQIRMLKNFRMAYELVLVDPYLTKMIQTFYTMHMKLMQEWGEMNPKILRFGENPNLFCHLPESLIMD